MTLNYYVAKMILITYKNQKYISTNCLMVNFGLAKKEVKFQVYFWLDGYLAYDKTSSFCVCIPMYTQA